MFGSSRGCDFSETVAFTRIGVSLEKVSATFNKINSFDKFSPQFNRISQKKTQTGHQEHKVRVKFPPFCLSKAVKISKFKVAQIERNQRKKRNAIRRRTRRFNPIHKPAERKIFTSEFIWKSSNQQRRSSREANRLISSVIKVILSEKYWAIQGQSQIKSERKEKKVFVWKLTEKKIDFFSSLNSKCVFSHLFWLNASVFFVTTTWWWKYFLWKLIKVQSAKDNDNWKSAAWSAAKKD